MGLQLQTKSLPALENKYKKQTMKGQNQHCTNLMKKIGKQADENVLIYCRK